MSHIEAVVFDLDDTLYDEHSYTLSGLKAVADAFSPKLNASFDLFQRMLELLGSEHSKRVFNVIAQEAEAANADSTVAAMIDTFRNHHPNISLLPDAERAISRLAGNQKLGLITDGYLTAQTRKVDALHLRDRLDAIIETDQWGREFWKPHPRAFDKMATMLQVLPSRCVYVADNLTKDFVAPNSLGWMTIHVRRPTGVYKEATAPAGGEPQHTIVSLDMLDSVIE